MAGSEAALDPSLKEGGKYLPNLLKCIFHLCRPSGGGGAEAFAVGTGEGGVTPETGPEAAFRGG